MRSYSSTAVICILFLYGSYALQTKTTVYGQRSILPIPLIQCCGPSFDEQYFMNIINQPLKRTTRNRRVTIMKDALDFTLDRSVIPRTSFLSQLTTISLFIAAIFVKKILKRTLSGDEATIIAKNINSNKFVITAIGEFITELVDTVTAKCNGIMTTAKGWMKKNEKKIKKNKKILNIMEWNLCSLKSKEQLSDHFTKVSFALKNRAAQFNLKLGQELIMCLSDPNGKVLKQTFFPLSVSEGSFDIVYRHSSADRGSDKLSDEFAVQMDSMMEKDEAGFKGGDSGIVYKGSEDPIRSLTIIAVGLGITPAIQLLKTVFGDSNTSIEEIEVLWMNERKSDFILNEYVEKIELSQIDKVFVTRVVDIDINQADTKINDKIQGAITPFESGRVAMYMGPEAVRSKAFEFFQNMGYIRNHAVDIRTS